VSLREYFELQQENAHPDGFKDFVVRKAGAGGISYRASHLADVLFEKKLNMMHAAEHDALLAQLDGGLQGLDDYPRDLEFDGDDEEKPALTRPSERSHAGSIAVGAGNKSNV
jgi:hypothetical protein